MGLVCQFYGSTIGKKICMALSGAVLVLFAIGHMAGNLKIFFGKEANGVYRIDAYGEFLRTFGSEMLGHGGFLWVVRAVLLACLALHVVSAIQLSIINRRARTSSYAVSAYSSANAASRTMLYGGLFLLAFVVLHILHFTTGTVHTNGFVEGKVFANVWLGFQNPVVGGLYIFAMACLGLHLYHGTWSMFQTLGVDSPRWNPTIRCAAKVVSILLFIGFSAVPAAVMLGLLHQP